MPDGESRWRQSSYPLSFTIHSSSLTLVLLRFRKFIIRIKARNPFGVCYAKTDREGDFRLLRHPSEIPGIAVFVRRLMIMGRIVCLELLFAPAGRAPDEIFSRFQINRRDTRFGKREMV